MNWQGVRAKRKGERVEHPEPIPCDAPREMMSEQTCDAPATVKVMVSGTIQHLCPKHLAMARQYFSGQTMPDVEAI